MSMLLPAQGDAVLTEAEMMQCLRHYVLDKPSRAWIDEGDTAPELIWDFNDDMARLSSQLPAEATAANARASAPPLPLTNARWRDQYLKPHLPKEVEKAAGRVKTEAVSQCPAAAAPSASLRDTQQKQEYVLISEDEEEGEEDEQKSSASPPMSQRSAESAASSPRSRVADSKVHPTTTRTSPSPRRDTHKEAISPRQESRESARQSTGSSVVFLSQPPAKMVETGAAKGLRGRPVTTSKSTSRGREQETGEELGKKRQRSMEEFMYRGA